MNCRHARQQQEGLSKHLGNKLGGVRSSSLLPSCACSLGKLQPRLQCLAPLSRATMPCLVTHSITSHHAQSSACWVRSGRTWRLFWQEDGAAAGRAEMLHIRAMYAIHCASTLGIQPGA